MSPAPLLRRFCLAALAAGALAACSGDEKGPIIVSVIGDRDQLATPYKYLPAPAAKLMLESTAQGLVAFDAAGDIMPALAQRWIVQEDGRSYIFRLRRATWPNGARVTAKDVARMVNARIELIRATDPDGPLDAVSAAIPMTGEVVEIRLLAARPNLLQMLAQPQMGLSARNGGTGPYSQQRWGRALMLEPVSDPADPVDEAGVPPEERRILRAEKAALAVARFDAGQAALVLGGRYADLPLTQQAGIDASAIRIDPVMGLFGLAVTGDGPLMDDDGVRAAISMVIDRDQLPGLLGLGRWSAGPDFVPQQLELPRAPTRPDWAALSMEDRVARARAAVARWRAGHDGPPPAIRIAMPPGPGSILVHGLIDAGLRRIGLSSVRVGPDDKADLTLIDEVAPYDSVLWYLGRIACARGVHCSGQAQAKLQEASLATTSEERQARIAEAEALTVAHNGYIGLGAPVRWSLVSRRLTSFAPSPRARHPLNHLLREPN